MCGMLDGGIGRGGSWWERGASLCRQVPAPDLAMMSRDGANPREDEHNSAAVRAVNPCTTQGMCVYCLLKAQNHYQDSICGVVLPKVPTRLLVVWSRPDPVDQPPPHQPPTETTADPVTVTGHQPSNAPWEDTTCLTPVPQRCKNAYIWKSCDCVCVPIF